MRRCRVAVGGRPDAPHEHCSTPHPLRVASPIQLSFTVPAQVFIMLACGKRFSQAELTQLLQSLLHEACHGSGGDDVFLKCGCHGVDSGIEVIHCILCAINSRVQGFLCRPLCCLMFRACSLQRCLHSFGLGWQSESMNVATVVGRRRHPWGRRFPGASRRGRSIARSTEARKLVGGCRHISWMV